MGNNNSVNKLPNIDGINLNQSTLIDSDNNRLFIKLPLSFTQIFNNDASKFDSILYDRNRPIDKQRASRIANNVDSKENYHWGTITIGVINSNPNQPFLLDGQHRLWATTIINKIFYAYIQIIKFNCMSNMHDFFVDLNQGIPLPVNYKTSHELITNTIPNKVCLGLIDYWINRHPNILHKNLSSLIKSSSNPHPPNINLNIVKNSISSLFLDTEIGSQDHFFIRTNPDQTAENFLKLLYEFNESFSQKTSNFTGFRWSQNSRSKDRIELSNKCNEVHFWLGYLRNFDIDLINFTRSNFFKLFPITINDPYMDVYLEDGNNTDDECIND